MEATQYQALIGNDWLFKVNATVNTYVYRPHKLTKSPGLMLTTTNYHLYYHGMTKRKRKRKKNLSGEQIRDFGVITAKVNQPQNRFEKRKEKGKNKKISQHNLPPLHMSHILYKLRPPTIDLNSNASLVHVEKCFWIKEYGMTFQDKEEHVMKHATLRCLEGYPHNKHEIWRMAYAMAEGATISELWEIKTNPLSFPEPKYVATFDVFGNIEDDSKEFHEHYQQLAPTREKQEEWLAQLNTQLCDHCLISYNFQYCNECNLIYNPPIRIIYMIPEEKEPISSCASESESPFNPNSNPDNNNNENTGSSSIQYGNNNDTNSNSDSNSNTKYKQYITISDLTKELELK
ncbi:hypothetical protein G9A89_005724 [Geosiphon pyriformis]|nr:hypothetical protein G9A89_005724 [Geosiphon pyriformis]